MLSIRVFNINHVVFSDKTDIQGDKLLINSVEFYKKNSQISSFNQFIKNFQINIISPNERNVSINSIMDFIPISTKVLGEIGSGITHTLTGVVFMLTGVDESGIQICSFGQSNGILAEQVKFSKAGTPKDTDYIVHIDIEVHKGAQFTRDCINTCHNLCDIIIQDIRNILKKQKQATERHDFEDIIPNPNKDKIVILKQVAGQGAMYDTYLFPSEPSGCTGGYSIIDCMNMPVFLTPNEYRDGAIKALH